MKARYAHDGNDGPFLYKINDPSRLFAIDQESGEISTRKVIKWNSMVTIYHNINKFASTFLS